MWPRLWSGRWLIQQRMTSNNVFSRFTFRWSFSMIAVSCCTESSMSSCETQTISSKWSRCRGRPCISAVGSGRCPPASRCQCSSLGTADSPGRSSRSEQSLGRRTGLQLLKPPPHYPLSLEQSGYRHSLWWVASSLMTPQGQCRVWESLMTRFWNVCDILEFETEGTIQR